MVPARAVMNRQQGRSDMYLPAMPDMLRGPGDTSGSLRYGQKNLAGTKANSVIRGQSADENTVRTPRETVKQNVTGLTMPMPETLGLALPKAGEQVRSKSDWASARQKLDKLGATFYRLEKVPDGRFRFSCAVPHAKLADRQQQFEATGPTEEESIHQVLAQIEHWLEAR